MVSSQTPIRRTGGVLEAEKKVPKAVVLVFECLICVQERRRCFGVRMSHLRAGKKGNGPNRSLNDLKQTKKCTFIGKTFLPVRSYMI